VAPLVAIKDTLRGGRERGKSAQGEGNPGSKERRDGEFMAEEGRDRAFKSM